MTDDYHERSRLMSARTICLTLGILAGGALAPVLVGAFGGGPGGYARMSWVMAALILATMLGLLCRHAGCARDEPGAGGWPDAAGVRLALRPRQPALRHPDHLQVLPPRRRGGVHELPAVPRHHRPRPARVQPGRLRAGLGRRQHPLDAPLARRQPAGRQARHLPGGRGLLPARAALLARSPRPAKRPPCSSPAASSPAWPPAASRWLRRRCCRTRSSTTSRRTGLRREAMFSAVYSVAEKLASATGPFLLGLVLSAASGRSRHRPRGRRDPRDRLVPERGRPPLLRAGPAAPVRRRRGARRMADAVSISKSVARAFQVLELFRGGTPAARGRGHRPPAVDCPSRAPAPC